MKRSLILIVCLLLTAAVATAAAVGSTNTSRSAQAKKLTIGFVTHAVGNPFIKQVEQAARDAGKDLGVNVKVEGTPAFDPAAQLKMVQDLFASGADGVATSITGDSMASGLNALVAQGKPIVEFNIFSTRVHAPYVGERSVGDWAILGKAVRAKMGGGGKVLIGTCAPGFPALVDRIRGVKRGLGRGVTVKGPFDVTGDPTKNYTAWQQLIAANPDAKALIGVCAQDLETLGKLNSQNGDKFITAGGDPTLGNLAAIAGGHGLISMGQTGYIQGYLPIKMIVDALRSRKALPKGGFISSGAEIITKSGVVEPYGLPRLTPAQIKGFQTNSRAQHAFYKRLFSGKGVFANWRKHIEPIANASR
ncbi:MAG: sugar ABC transporter substrate-binding protein [Gaiellaceae bacterium]